MHYLFWQNSHLYGTIFVFKLIVTRASGSSLEGSLLSIMVYGLIFIAVKLALVLVGASMASLCKHLINLHTICNNKKYIYILHLFVIYVNIFDDIPQKIISAGLFFFIIKIYWIVINDKCGFWHYINNL